MYGRASADPPLEWAWVDAQLAAAGTYWVTARGAGVPHPRPVWGVWTEAVLYLSVGSPVIARRLEPGSDVVVHLDSGVDVVIVEGSVVGPSGDRTLLERYDEKYDWTYTVEELGPLTAVAPTRVLAWRSAGWAGREGFEQTGRWRFRDEGPGRGAATSPA
jgi:hypothetical protein